MKKVLSLAVATLLGLAGSAHASQVDVLLGNTSSSLSYSSSASVVASNIGLVGAGAPTLNNAQIVAAGVSSSGNYASPTGTLSGGNYVAILGVPTTGSATFSLSENTFGFTWGTIDTYNALTLTDARGVTYTISGSDILSHLAGSVQGASQADVSFFDPFANIVSAQLTSSQNSFEAANFGQKVSQVPLPAALPMFGMGLAGLFGVSRKAKKSA